MLIENKIEILIIKIYHHLLITSQKLIYQLLKAYKQIKIYKQI